MPNNNFYNNKNNLQILHIFYKPFSYNYKKKVIS